MAIVFLQLLWIVFSQKSNFPFFETTVLFTIVMFMVHERDLADSLQNSRAISQNTVVFVLAIATLLACLAGIEKFLASYLIWATAVLLQALIIQYACRLCERKQSFHAPVLLLVMATQIVVAFFIFGDTNYYWTEYLTQHMTVRTTQYFHLGSLSWIAFFYVLPAFLAFVFFERYLPASRHFWRTLQKQGDEPFKDTLTLAWVLPFTIMTLLAVEMMRPHFGLPVTLGDESGYTIYARALASFKPFLPSQPPIYMGILGVLTWIFGDWPQIGLVLNYAALIGTFALLVYAAQVLTKNLFFSLLAVMLFVGNRGTYLYVWTPLTETMNMLVVAGVIASALYFVQKKTTSSYVWLALATAAAILFRSQSSLFSYMIIILSFWYVYRTGAPRPDRRQLAIFALVFFLPQIAWGLYRYKFTGHLELTDARGPYMLYGFNYTGMVRSMRGLTWEDALTDKLVWTDALNAWMAAHPGWVKKDMVAAAIKMRLENPRETLSFWYWRLLELFNFRFYPQLGIWAALRMNAQLLLMYGLFALTFFWRFSRAHLIAIALLAGFYISFIIVYCESRYRYPGDIIVYLAIVRCLYQVFSPSIERLDAPVDAGYLRIFTRKWFYGPIAAILLMIALPNVTGIEPSIPGWVPTKTLLARAEPLTIADARTVALKDLSGHRLGDLSGRIVTVPVVFEGFRLRAGDMYGAARVGMPEGNFNYGSLDGLEVTVQDPSSTPSELKVKKFGFDTQSIYWGPQIKIDQHALAKVLLLKKPVIRGPEGATLVGYLLEIDPISAAFK